MNRNALTAYIDVLEPATDSNLKFMMMMKTALISTGIPPEDAVEIVACMQFDLSNVSEDDGFIGDLAVAYADYCKKAYDKLKLNGLTNRKLYDRIFNRVFLKVE